MSNEEEKKEEEEDEEEENLVKSKKKPKKIRFEWLDQFRGLVILLFIVQTCAYLYSGDPANGIMPILAPALNHGYKYARFARPMITIMDIGQQIFIFLVGFMQGFAIFKRKQKGIEEKQLWIHIIKRFLLVIVLSIIHSFGSGKGFDVYFIFFNGTMGNIAWAGLAAGIAALYIPKADTRLYVGLGVMVAHMILYAIPGLKNWESANSNWEFPYNMLNHLSIGIVATSYTSWFINGDGTINSVGIKNRVLPVSMFFFIAEYCLDFIQWADHHEATTPLVLLSVGSAGFLIFIFYKMDEVGFSVIGLTALGKNMLTIFILEMVINELLYFPLITNLLRINGLLDLIFLGLIPIVLMWIIAKTLEKFDIIIKI